jgi:hypothetical protein
VTTPELAELVTRDAPLTVKKFARTPESVKPVEGVKFIVAM